jgi:hypothetical protein
MKLILAKMLKEARPNISKSSIITYSSYLNTLLKNKVPDEPTEADIVEYLNKNSSEIIKSIKEKPISTKKTILSAVFIITKNEEIHKEMMKLIQDYNDHDIKQEKTETQKENWITYDDVKNKYAETTPIALEQLKGEKPAQYSFLNQFILFCLSSGIFFPPRRSEDLNLLKIKKYDPTKDNHYDCKKGKIVFHKYKTSDKYGQYTIDVKKQYPELHKILQLWCKINPTDTMLFSSNLKPFSSPQVNIYNRNFWNGKNVSTNIYRHSFITEFYKGKTPSMEQISALSKSMSHSINRNLLYRRI